jgi:hypothetical protein
MVLGRRTRSKPLKSAHINSVDFAKAVLLMRWSDGLDVSEPKLVQSAFRADEQIILYNAHDSDDVIAAVNSWIEAGFAQVLYIGAHGEEKGLMPAEHSPTILSWNRLGAALSHRGIQSIQVALGACDSAHAAAAWGQLKQLSASVLFSFLSTVTEEDELYSFLLKLVDVTGLFGPGSKENRLSHDLTFLEDDIAPLTECSARLRIFRKTKDGFTELQAPEGHTDAPPVCGAK